MRLATGMIASINDSCGRDPGSAMASVIDRLAHDRAGHAMAAAAAAAELGADDGDDLDAFLAQERVGVGVAVVGENDTRRDAYEVGAAVPLCPLAHVGRAAGLDDAHLLDAERLADRL